MRARHTTHTLSGFPVWSADFLSPNDLVLGGGGGASRSGIKNKLRLYHVGDERSLDLIDEFELEKGEDAPMSMAAHTKSQTLACGVNSIEEKLANGQNENCRIFAVKDRKLSGTGAYGTLQAGDIEDYQKVTVLSPDGKLLAVAGRNDLSLLSYPSLLPAASPIRTEHEIYDASFSSTTLVIATTNNLLAYSLPAPAASPTKEKGKNKSDGSIPQMDLQHTAGLPDSTVGSTGSFRSARYLPANDAVMYTVINTSPIRSRNKRSPPRQSFVCKWDTKSWKVEKVKKVGDRVITCFDVSVDGKFLGYGSSDLSIGLLDANTLSPLVSILNAHELTPATIKFNPTSTLLVSGSADNTVRIMSVPQATGGSSFGVLMSIFLAVLVILLAVAAQKYLASGQPPW